MWSLEKRKSNEIFSLIHSSELLQFRNSLILTLVLKVRCRNANLTCRLCIFAENFHLQYFFPSGPMWFLSWSNYWLLSITVWCRRAVCSEKRCQDWKTLWLSQRNILQYFSLEVLVKSSPSLNLWREQKSISCLVWRINLELWMQVGGVGNGLYSSHTKKWVMGGKQL